MTFDYNSVGSVHSGVYPSVQSAEIGDTVRFMCDSQLTKRWGKNGNVLPRNAKVSGKLDRILTITDVRMFNEGTYECILRDRLYTHTDTFMAVLKVDRE